MYQPHEIVARLSPALAEQFFAFLQAQERKLYRATIDTLAKQRNFRPVFIERMPMPKRHALMNDMLGRAQNNAISAHLLQIWFVGGHAELLCDFLDALGIKHDEKGTIEELPPAPDKATLGKAIDETMAKHDPGLVAAYLHAFQALDDTGGWSSLEELLAGDERLKL
ncbi:MAG: hypothetical protein ABMA13_19240 [Chthoniobacteraceae bacterium]